MSGEYWSLPQLVGAGLAVALAFGPVVVLVVARRSLGALNAAAWLVVWGAFIVAGEHASFGVANALELASEPNVSEHSRYHFLMAGTYTLIGAVMMSVVALTLLREGRRSGWYAVLFALVLGGGIELLGGTTVFAHGLPPDSIPVGLSLYGYFAAWGSALVMAYRPSFGRKDPPAARRAPYLDAVGNGGSTSVNSEERLERAQ